MRIFITCFILCLSLCGCNIEINRETITKEQRLNRKAIGFGGCSHCGDKWNWKEAHSTFYKDTGGMFPLCEECFAKLTYPYALWYHLKTFEDWKREPTYEQINRLSMEIAQEKDTTMWAVSWIKEQFYKNGKLKSIYTIKY